MNTEKIYKYGKPDKYGDFPYLYSGKYKQEELNEILRERLPENFDMQIVDPLEETVIADCSKLGIDSHLEAMIQNKPDRIEDRKIGDRIVQKHHAFDFSPDGMICLLRRLAEYNPRDHHSFDDQEIDPETGESEKEKALFDAAYNLRSCILEVLQIEGSI